MLALSVALVATGCKSKNHPSAQPTPTPGVTSSAPSATPSATTSAKPSASASAMSSATPTASPKPTVPPATGPAPAHFQPVDFSFVGQSVGWALGQTCGDTVCQPVMARTTDAGHSWHESPHPPTTASPDAPEAVSQVRFGNLRNGWLFAPSLWSTHDGGNHWKKLSLPGEVFTLEEAKGTTWAVVRSCPGDGACTFSLWTAPQDSDAFTRRTTLPYSGDGTVGLVRFSASYGWLTSRGSGTAKLWRTTNAGRTWTSVPDPCATAFDYGPAQWVSRVDAANVWILCGGDAGAGHQRKAAFHSTDGGRHWGSRNDPSDTGNVVDFFALSPSTALLATTHSGLLRTTNGGISWHAVAPDCCDFGFGKIESIDMQHVWAIGPGANAIFFSADRGAHWGKYTFHT
jgi:photosystem II stability/assembly factor-like uncharacterized protein